MYSSARRDALRRYLNSFSTRLLTEETPLADQPAWIKVPLRPHQLTLRQAALNLEKHALLDAHVGPGHSDHFITKYGVLGDRVGAGKSLVALSLIKEPPPTVGILGKIHSGGATILNVSAMRDVTDWDSDVLRDPSSGQWRLPAEFLSRVNVGRCIYTRTALVIVPHTVMGQWEEYVRNQTSLSCQFVRRKRDCDNTRQGYFQEILTADAVIVSNTMFRQFMLSFDLYGWQNFAHVVWSRLFVDEADTIRLSLTEEQIRARFYWFISGSWLNIMFPEGFSSWSVTGLPEDLRGALGNGAIMGVDGCRLVNTMLSRDWLPELTLTLLRNRNDWIEKSIRCPRILHREIECRAPASTRLLRGLITQGAMEALHAGDMAGAMTALGLKGASKAGIVDRVSASLKTDIAKVEKTRAGTSNPDIIKSTEERLTQLREQLVSLESRVSASLSGGAVCPICYEPPATLTLTPCCRQAFCLTCICECIRGRPVCPLCRKSIGSSRDLLVMDETAGGGGGDEPVVAGLPNKKAALLNLLGSAVAGERYLVFSAHEESFKGLRAAMADRGICCEVLGGAASRMARIRRDFQSGKIQVLCMNAKHVGTGVNLEAATHVVLYHKMNTELEKQVIGRAVRFEREGDLHVIHLVHEGETGTSYMTSKPVFDIVGDGADDGVITHV